MARRRKKIDLEQEIQRLERELDYANRQIHETQSGQEANSQDYTTMEDGDHREPNIPRVTVSLPPQENYDGHGRPWESFISSFRSLASTCKWNEREQRFRLLACLRGDAADFVFQQLGEEIVADFDKLTAALESRFGCRKSASTFVSQLESRRLGVKESIADYAADIRRLATFGYPTADASTLDTIATRHFLRGLGDNNMSMAIGMHEPKTLQQAREIAERYHHLREEAVRSNSRGGVRSISSSDSTAVTEEKLVGIERRLMSNIEDKIAKLSEEIRKLRSDSYESRPTYGQSRQTRGRPQARSSFPPRCYECQELGHIARNCPRRQYYGGANAPNYQPPPEFNPTWQQSQPQPMPQWMPQHQPSSSMPPPHQRPPQQQQQPPYSSPSADRSSGN